ncbi:MAG TPA: ribonuclease R [Ruminococcaceae bacterium]|nr:ribonuclease R [Oscillospiraceae bacterium]
MNNFKLSILMGLYKAGEKGLSVRQLADQMGVNKKGMKKLEDALAEMKQHNDIAYKKGNCWIKHPETYFKAEVSRVSQRSGFVKQVGDMPQEYFVRGRDMCGAIPGDIVLAKMTAPSDDIHHSPEAVVLAVLEETDALLTGVIVAEGNKLMVLPDKLCSDPLVIAKVSKAAAMHVGDKVVFSIKKRGERHMDHTVNIVDVFGSSDTAKAGAEAYMMSNRLHVNFPDDVLLEAAKLDIDEPDGDEILRRLDLRGEPIFTIDGADTKDIDDAVSISKTDRCYKLGVHIADVSHYVPRGCKIDEEAFYRGTSIYYADQVVPMLPKQLSNGICSLNPQVDRLAFSCLMEVSFQGKLLNYRFEKSVIRSRVKGVYSEVNKIIDGTADEEIKAKYARVIDRIPIMKELAEILEKNRIERGAPEIDTSETKIITDENGVCIDVKPRTTGIAEGIIEEFMLMANNSAAALAMKEKIPFVYRVHEAPTFEKLDALRETLTALGINPGALGMNAPAGELARILRENKDSDRAMVINRIVLRTMMKARYSEEPLGHYGLVMPEYAHFTSPIRRYADLSIHRILTDYVYALSHEKLCRKYAAFAQSAALQASNTELSAIRCERDCENFYMAEYMKSHIGEEFDGIISGVSAGGIYVLLPNTVEGMVSVATLPLGDYEVQHGVILTGAADGSVFTVGDKVHVKCVSVNVNGGFIDFELC